MNRILVILTLDTNNLPANFPEILEREREVVAQWKKDGVLEHLFLRPERNGAILILKDVNEEQATELILKLPLYPVAKSIERISLIQQF